MIILSTSILNFNVAAMMQRSDRWKLINKRRFPAWAQWDIWIRFYYLLQCTVLLEYSCTMYILQEPRAARNANSKHRQIYVLLVSQCFLGTKNTLYVWWFQRSDQDTNFLMANNDLPDLDIYCYLYNIKFRTSNIMKNRNQYSVMILNLN